MISRDEATELVRHVLKVAEELGSLGATAGKIDDGEWRVRLLRAVGEAMSDLDGRILRPILEQHPDLEPDPQFRRE